MSNPVATIGNSIPTPGDPSVIRKTFTSIIYEQQSFFIYAEGEYTSPYSNFDPTDKGQRFYIFVLLEDALGTKPQFVTTESWDNVVSKAGSGFLTGRFSVMPKLFIPSLELVDNGFVSTDGRQGAYADPGADVEAFNWLFDTFNGGSVSDLGKYGHIGGLFGSQYIAVTGKDDAADSNAAVLTLDNPPQNGGTAPASGAEGWDTGHDLVVDGAFVMMLNVTPSQPGAVDPTTVQENQWTVLFEFGDIEMNLNQDGALKVKFLSASDAEENVVTVNLNDGKAKEGPPQQQHITDKPPYIIAVYPVWNGIIVMSGNQESPDVVKTSSTFVPMQKGRSVLVPPYSSGFDPTAPAEVEVGTGAGATNTIPDFGSTMTVTAENARIELAYLPCFFCREMWFDEWFIASDDSPGVVEYSYNVYAIWTANGTAASLGSTAPVQSVYAGPITDSSYWYVQWRMSMTKHDRYAGEIFGSILEIQEERDFPIKNGNGSFSLLWSGGSAGDPSPGSWEDYIQSISVSVGLDGSDGSITVDRYGVAGQDAIATQSIGAITIDMTGGNGTVAGTVFQGLALGITEQADSGGASWEIPLTGLEKKLDDIALINVPFFDGEPLSTAVSFLCKYAGLIPNYANAPNAGTDNLSVSEDVNVPRFDWKSGTTVRSAMEDVMNDRNYNYVIFDGTVYIYELDGNGLPVFTGTNWQPSYPDTKLITENQQPDFEDLRNEIVVIGLRQVPEGTGTDIAAIPLFPRFERRSTTTVPDVPWAKSRVLPVSGALSATELSGIADDAQDRSANYVLIGRTTIPGNGSIRPYDTWGSLIIYSVTHNIDFNAKTWTTDLEFARST